MTLISAHNSEGCYGRCDARCYEAAMPECNCICGGANHGVGKQLAMNNTSQLAEQWIGVWEKEHPGSQYLIKRNGKLVSHEQLQLV